LNYKSIFSLSPGRSRAVFLDETDTASLTISDVAMLKEKIFKQMEDALIRYKASWIE
jgi:1-acyl-sn-glycerol-3-phosphate acyltransferase